MLFIRLLLYWYREQTYCVQWGSVYSNYFKTSNGVKQGGILSPKLFNVFMDDLTIELKKAKVGCSTPYDILNHLMYADDLNLLCPSAKGLQVLINVCKKYANEHSIIFNVTKTVCSVISSKQCIKMVQYPKLFLNDLCISYVDSHKYLGVFISSVNDNNDINRQLRSYITRVNMLVRVFNKCSPEVKTQLFESYCVNMYCPFLWHNYHKTTMQNFRVTYNNGFRKLLSLNKRCSASGMFAYSEVMSFDEIMRKMSYNFIQRLYKSKNIFITYFTSSFARLKSNMWINWQNCLYCFAMH